MLFSPDSARLLILSETGSPVIWNMEKSTTVVLQSNDRKASLVAAFSKDGTFVVADSRLWRTSSGELLKDYSHVLDEPALQFSSVSGLVGVLFEKDGSHVLTIDDRGNVRRHSLPRGSSSSEPLGDGELVAIVNSARPFSTRALAGALFKSAAFQSDGERVATINGLGKLELTDLRDPSKMLLLPDGNSSMNSVELVDDDLILTTSKDMTARLYLSTGNMAPMVVGWSPPPMPVEWLPRCLTQDQLKRFDLDPEPPDWCVAMGKWPYDSASWRRRLAEECQHLRSSQRAFMFGKVLPRLITDQKVLAKLRSCEISNELERN
jgi:WD40 repeat protein